MYSKDLLNQQEYEFIRHNEHLGNKIILLGLSGSISYGTNNDNSDIDLRGVSLNSKSDLLGLTTFEQYVDDKTDSCIYGFNKMMKLLINCNPNTIELLGLLPEHYLFLSNIGNELLEHKQMFLSKVAVQSFGGYASAQLRRLQNAIARDSVSQDEKERHIMNSIRNAMYEFKSRYMSFEDGKISLYIDEAVNKEFETEIFMDVELCHYPLRDYKSMWSEMSNIVKDYEKIGKRNHKKDDNHLNKHAMHLIRLFMMSLDILEKQEINTYRIKELALLKSIRVGEFQKADGGFRQEFYDLLKDYEKKLDYAAKNTALPDLPDMKRVEEFIIYVNERVVKDEIS